MLLAAFAVAGCPRAKPKLADLTNHQVKRLDFWKQQQEVPLADRIFEAPPELLDYMDLDNRFNGYSGTPKHAPLAPALKAEISHSLAGLPPELRRLLDTKLLGIFVVSGLGSSAYTDYVRNDKKQPKAAFVVLDVDAMSRNANDWITWKENSPFIPDPSMRLEFTIEKPEENNREKALEYVLVHEFGHVLAFDSDVHPLWSLPPKRVDVEDYPFMYLSWTVREDEFRRRIEGTFPLPGALVFYKPSDERPSATRMPEYYDWLAKTSFPSLYGATNPYDDFAESLVTYVHAVLLKKPYEIKVFKDGKLERTVGACWSEPRCAKKRILLEEFLHIK